MRTKTIIRFFQFISDDRLYQKIFDLIINQIISRDVIYQYSALS